MAYTCISADEVRTTIEKAEKTLNECFDMLLDFRYGRNDFGNAILKFQPLLAECLLDLMRFYQKLMQEKDTLISLKGSYDKSTFSNIMQTNSRYSKVVSTCIEIGKDMGDSFAWFFFRDNRKELEEHFEHESTGLYVSGIGGKGELEFIKRASNIDGLYVIYHSITSMLRIGDFSLYDFDYGIAGVGELKTKQVDNSLQTTATITAKTDIRLPKSPQEKEIKFEDRVKELKRDFPKIEQQLATHENLLRIKDSDNSLSFYSSYDYVIFDGLTPESPFALNSDNSLMIVASWSKYESLYDILFENENDIEHINSDFQLKAKSLVDAESKYNMLFIGNLNTRISRLSMPILWWGIDEKICRDIYFRKLSITTIFNPAKLLQYFVDDGFSVTTSNKLADFEIFKKVDNHRIDVGNFHSLCYLITNNFMKTKDVYTSSKHVTTAMESGEFQSNSRVELRIRLSNFDNETKIQNESNSREDETNGQTQDALTEQGE